MGGVGPGEQTYVTLIFALLDKARPKPEANTERDGVDHKG